MKPKQKRAATKDDVKRGLAKLCRECPYRRLGEKVLDAVARERGARRTGK